MDGLTFFMISWLGWIFTSFIMSRSSKLRLYLTVFILLTIIVYPYKLEIFNYHISFSSCLFLFVSSILIVSREGKTAIYLLIHCFILCLAYASFNLFALFDPVWILFSYKLMASFILYALSVILQKEMLERFILIVLGAAQGDILYAISLKGVAINYPIGSAAFLDIVALAVGFLFLTTLVDRKLLIAKRQSLFMKRSNVTNE